MSVSANKECTVSNMVAILNAAFEAEFPVWKRRWEAVTYKQPKMEEFNCWFPKLRSMLEGCNLEKMTPEDWKCLITLSKVTNADIRKEMLKVKEPTLKKYLETGQFVDLMQRSEGTVTATVARFEGNGNSNSNGNGNSNNRDAIRNPNLVCFPMWV